MYMHKKIFVIRQKKEVYRKSWFQNRTTNRTIGEDGLVLLIRKQNFDWDELFLYLYLHALLFANGRKNVLATL